VSASYTVNFNAAAEPEVLMASLLLQIETSFQIQNGETKKVTHTHDLKRQRATPCSAEIDDGRKLPEVLII